MKSRIKMDKEKALIYLKDISQLTDGDYEYRKRLAIILHDVIRKQNSFTGEQIQLIKEAMTRLNEQVDRATFMDYYGKLSDIGLDWIESFLE